MPSKARRMLVLLLIILKEAGPTAACSSSCSSDCDCSSRGLTGVPQDLPTTITILNLENNTIANLSQSDFSRYRSLTRLDLGSNQISMIHNKTFHNLTSLTRLDLDDNQLSILTLDTFVGLDDLEYLDLGQNQVTTSSLPAGIFVGLSNLQTLYLWQNQLTSLPADIFVGLGNLQNLYLYRNQLTTLPADIFAGLGNLRRLLLHYNQLTNLTADIFAGLGNLQYLYLSQNKLSTLPAAIFVGLDNLRVLRLNNNQFEILPPIAYGTLASIPTVPTDIFPGLVNLQLLWLSQNKLKVLSPVAYDILGSIDVRSDYITHTVRLESNPWQCDCRMLPFRRRMNGSYSFEDQIRCAGPANLAGQYLRDVRPEDLICEETTPVYSISSTKRVVDSTLSLTAVSSSPPYHQSAKSASKAPTLSPTSSNAPTADPGGSIGSTSHLSDHSAKSTSKLPTPHTAPPPDPNRVLSTVSTESPFGFQSTMTEGNPGPTGDGIVLPVPILATLCVCLGIFIICTIAFGVWCMYRRRTNATGTGMSSGNNTHNMRLHTVTIADRIGQSKTSHLDRKDSQHTYNLPNDDPEYDTIADINQSESPQEGAGNTQSLDSFGYLVLPPPPPHDNPTGPQAGAHSESGDGYEVPSRSLTSENGGHSQAKEDPQSHK
ncbi:uncharacterized protein LOC144861104 [Branchiostoma floridae x Branchiostoma japonicum]